MRSPVDPPTDRKAAAATLAADRRSDDYEVTAFGRRRVSSAAGKAVGRAVGRFLAVIGWPFRTLYAAFRHKGGGR